MGVTSLVNPNYHTSVDAAKYASLNKNEEQKLREACQGFEAIFTQMMFKSMRSATMDGGLVKKSNAEKIFTDMLDEQMADESSKLSANGIADMLFGQLKDTLSRGDGTDEFFEKHAGANAKPEGKTHAPDKSLKGYMPKRSESKIDEVM